MVQYGVSPKNTYAINNLNKGSDQRHVIIRRIVKRV